MRKKITAIRVRRIYETPDQGDGARVLVDRLWPRGISRERAALNAWMKEIAPSDDLRRQLHAKPESWSEFLKGYRAELGAKPEALKQLRELVASRTVTLLYAARDEEHNNAVALRQFLETA